MDNLDKRRELKGLIKSIFQPFFGSRCIHVDAPFYQNIGDVLIWQGCKAFYKDCGIECIYTGSHETFNFPDIDLDVVICFNGGGNIGDLYPEHIDLLKKIVIAYPKNRIIVFPQTVFYKDQKMFELDFEELNQHPDIHFAARDKDVFNKIYPILGDKVVLSPDMAFYISEETIKSERDGIGQLVIERDDCEASGNKYEFCGADIRDWPVLQKRFMISTFINKIFYRLSHTNIGFMRPVLNRIWEIYATKVHCYWMMEEGVRFIKPYKTIATTRLHGCILSILLDKQEIIFINNSYGKNLNFYNSWLSDLDTLKMS